MNKWIEKYEQATNDYLHSLKSLQMSERTYRNYKKRLDYFKEFWIEKNNGVPSEQPTTADVKAWRDALLDSGLKISTVRQYMTEFGSFCERFSNADYGEEIIFDYNPVNKHIIPKERGGAKPYDDILSDDNLAKLWSFRKPYGYCGEFLRNQTIVTLALDSKLRNMEILDLKPNMIDFEYGEIEVIGKGNKYRVVDISPISVLAIKLYMEKERPKHLTDDDYLFGTTSSHEFGGNTTGSEEWHRGSSAWLSALIERHVYAITGVHNVRSHDLRHLGAKLDLNSGMSAEQLQGLLGHSSLTTTQIYSGRLKQKRGRESIGKVIEEKKRWESILAKMVAKETA